MLPRASRKARAFSASLQGKSAGQEAPQLLAALPAYQQLDSVQLDLSACHLPIVYLLPVNCLSVLTAGSPSFCPLSIVHCLLSFRCVSVVCLSSPCWDRSILMPAFGCHKQISVSLHGLSQCTYMPTAQTAGFHAEHGVTHASAPCKEGQPFTLTRLWPRT